MSAPPRGAELEAIRAVEAESLPALVWGGVKVITTELLAQMYGTDVKNIQMNHTRNLARFEQGVHFFKVSGKALADLRPTLSGSQISAKTRSLMLWTERGAARHAKMIETDQAGACLLPSKTIISSVVKVVLLIKVSKSQNSARCVTASRC